MNFTAQTCIIGSFTTGSSMNHSTVNQAEQLSILQELDHSRPQKPPKPHPETRPKDSRSKNYF